MAALLQNLISENEILERFSGVSKRRIRERSRAANLGVRIGDMYYFTEEQFLKLWGPLCSSYANGKTAQTSMRGARTEQSLGTCDRQEAARLLAKIQSEIFERHLRGGSSPESETFAGAALRYMEAGGERRFVAPLLRHFGDVPIDQIGQQMIDRAASALYPHGSNGTRSRQVYAPISAILKFAGFSRDIRRPRVPPGIIRWLTQDEAARLLNACSPHLRPLVLFFLLTGARAGEALWLDWRDVDLVRGHVSFPKTKSGHPRGVPLHRDVVSALANLPRRDGCVFRRPDGQPYERPRGDHNTSAGTRIGTAFQAAVRRAGLKDVRVHDCRHTWATWHYQTHHDLISLQQLGGWASLSMVTRYAHASAENYRAGINALPSFGPGNSSTEKIVGLEAS